MLVNSGAAWLLREEGDPRIEAKGCCTTVEYLASRFAQCSSPAPMLDIVAQQPAYLTFTSGSTGHSKAVPVCH